MPEETNAQAPAPETSTQPTPAPEKKKRHRRTRAELEAAKAAEQAAGKPTVKKRHRRTKAELEAAKAAEQTAKAPAKKAPAKKAPEATDKRKRKVKVELINVTVKEPKKNTRDGRKWPPVFMSIFATIRTKAPKAVAKDFQDFCEKHQNIEID
jgi:hypothetical protein